MTETIVRLATSLRTRYRIERELGGQAKAELFMVINWQQLIRPVGIRGGWRADHAVTTRR
jgi:hypothetical protein